MSTSKQLGNNDQYLFISVNLPFYGNIRILIEEHFQRVKLHRELNNQIKDSYYGGKPKSNYGLNIKEHILLMSLISTNYSAQLSEYQEEFKGLPVHKSIYNKIHRVNGLKDR